MLWFENRPEMQEVWREVRLQESGERADEHNPGLDPAA